MALDRRGGLGHLAGTTSHHRGGKRGALPEVVVVGLGHRRPESALEAALSERSSLRLPLRLALSGKWSRISSMQMKPGTRGGAALAARRDEADALELPPHRLGQRRQAAQRAHHHDQLLHLVLVVEAQ